MNPVIKTFQYGKHTVTLETGRVARQATGAVLCSIDQTTVLCTVVGAKTAKADIDFFPLGVHYQEKAYAAGKIPGGFFLSLADGSFNQRLIDFPMSSRLIIDGKSIDLFFDHEIAVIVFNDGGNCNVRCRRHNGPNQYNLYVMLY